MILFNNKKHINLLVLILINCQIALSQISGPTTICSGIANSYNCIPTAATYSWSSLPSVSVTITNITSQSTNFITNPLTPTTYTLICTTVSPNNTYSLIVNNNTPPAPTGVNTNVCEGSPINLIASGGAPTIQWFTAPTGGTSIYTGNTYNPGPITPGFYTYYLETSSGGCVSNRNSINLTVLPTPFVTINGGNTSICQGSNTNLSVSVSGGVAPYSYNWTPAANLSAPTLLIPLLLLQ